MRSILILLGAAALGMLFSSNALAKDITVHGKLQKTTEAGGWLIVTEKEKYLILNSRKYQKEQWFTEGNEVEASGEVKSGVMTIYMEGTPFEAHSLRPFEHTRSGSTADIDEPVVRAAERQREPLTEPQR